MQSGLFKLQNWYRMVPFAILAFALGFWGALRIDCGGGSIMPPRCLAPHHIGAAVIGSINLIKPDPKNLSDEKPWQTVLAAMLYYSLAFVGAFQVTVDSLRRDMRVVGAQRKRNHVIVCGLGQTGAQIVQSFRNANFDVVAITIDAGSPAALAVEKRDVPVLAGDGALPSLLKLAGLPHARALVVASGSDAKNVEIGMRARDAAAFDRKLTAPLKILAQVRADWLYDAITEHQGAVLGSERAEFRIFNLHANAAREMLSSASFGATVAASLPNPNIVIAGFGVMGSEMLVQAVLGTFALPGCRLAATILDQRGASAMASADVKCSHLNQIADLRFVATTFALDSGEARKTIDALLGSGASPHAVIIALRDDDIALHTALEFRRSLDGAGRAGVPVFVRLKESNKLGAFLASVEDKQARTPRLVPFGDLARLTTPEALLDERSDMLARAVHEVFLSAHGTDLTADEPWAKLPERLKLQNREFANHIATKLAAIGCAIGAPGGGVAAFTEDEVNALAEMEHWRWSLTLKSQGWRYAAARDNTAQLHPLLVEWNDLPEAAKEENRKMVRRIPDILAHAGLSVVRKVS